MSAERELEIFHLEKDRFSCITVKTSKVDYLSEKHFKEKLNNSLAVWKQDGVRGVWVIIPIEESQLVPIAVEAGFVFHHAKPHYVMLKQWLSTSEPENLPGFATQYLGCAGFVVNDKDQLLVIQEKFHKQKHWKLPGGLADPGEEVWEAAKREVFEETGIEAEFQYVLCFRHQHNFHFGNSDFYFICVMKALTHDIKKCDNEISSAKWMDIHEYANHPDLTQANRLIAQKYLESRSKPVIKPEPVIAYNKTSMTYLYSVHSKDECE